MAEGGKAEKSPARDRHTAAKALPRNTEETFRLVFEGNPLPMWIYDLATLQFLTVNDAAIQRYGYSRDEFLSMTIKDIRPPVDAPALLENASTVTEGLDTAGVWRHIKKDGTLIFVEIVSHTLRFEGRRAELVLAIDVTERRRSETALRESEERYRSVVERANDGILVIQDGIVRYVNERLADMGGYGVDELIGTRFLDFVHLEERANVAERYARRMAGQPVPAIYESALLRKDGSRAETEINAGVTTYDGKPADLVFVRDITERKRTEAELRRERDRAQKYLDVAGVMIVVIDSGQRVTLINRKGCEVLGYRQDEILGSDWFDNYVPERMRDQVRGVFGKLISGMVEPVRYSENPVLTRTGEERLIAWHNTLLYDDSGKIAAALSSGEDITEQRMAAEGIARSEARYRQLVEEISDWIWEADTKGRSTYSSPVAERIVGYKPEEVVGRPILDFVAPEDRNKCRQMLAAISAEGAEVTSHLCRARHKDGSIRYLEVSAAPRFEGGRLVGVRGVTHDVTDRATAEEEKRRFYRTAIYSLTGGKLEILTEAEAKDLARPVEVNIAVRNAKEARAARPVVREALERHGLTGDRLKEFTLALGEAMNNAVKHAREGVVTAGARDGVVWVSVCDNGPGIEELSLPRVALEKGFSTKPSLGLGYSIILGASDRVALATGPEGTRVVMEKNLAAVKPLASLLDRLPDTW